jgi:sugar/nucleoside kinase (ribokinase family)
LYDVVTVGHLCIDSIYLPNHPQSFTVLGGSAAYVSFAASRLEAQTSIISKVGQDFPAAYKWWMQQEGVDLSGLTVEPKQSTTRFELRYDETLANRSLSSKCRMEPLKIDDVPSSLKARIIHVAPIANEVSYEVMLELRDHAELLSLDAQGLVRCFDENGIVSLCCLKDKRILKLTEVLKSTRAELQALTGLCDVDSAVKTLHGFGIGIIIVTLGVEGAIVSVDSAQHAVPAYEPVKLVDPTGAGDAFIGGFLAEYAQGEDCAWSSYVGSAAASTVIEGIGPTKFSDKTEIIRRAHILEEKGHGGKPCSD